MPWLHLELDVLAEFADVHHLVDRSTSHSPHAAGLEGLRVAYRDRNAERGLCRSCPLPAVPGRQTCHVHLAANADRARRSWRARNGSKQS